MYRFGLLFMIESSCGSIVSRELLNRLHKEREKDVVMNVYMGRQVGPLNWGVRARI